MKVLSRFASPAGFALVLLLFLLLPFASVSCSVPEYGDVGANYTGGHLVTGTDPEVGTELQDLANDLGVPADVVDPPASGVQALAIVLAVLMAAGVLTVLIPHFKARLLGGTALAGVSLVVTVATMVVAQGNLASGVVDVMRRSGLAEEAGSAERLQSAADDMTHTEVGFWLMLVLLGLLVLVTATAGLFGDRLRAAEAERASHSGGGFDGLSFGGDGGHG